MGKFLHKMKTDKNIPIYAAVLLLCMTLISSYFTSGVYANYATGSQSSDNARVAKFSIVGEGVLFQPIEANLIPGMVETANLNIHNNSEVAVEYTVTVTNATNNLPLHLRMIKTDSSQNKEGNNITFTEQQLPGDHTDHYTLYIDWRPEDDDPALMGMVDYIAVTVTAVQID